MPFLHPFVVSAQLATVLAVTVPKTLDTSDLALLENTANSIGKAFEEVSTLGNIKKRFNLIYFEWSAPGTGSKKKNMASPDALETTEQIIKKRYIKERVPSSVSRTPPHQNMQHQKTHLQVASLRT
ncbi:hypothetical protein HYALB_00009631 [Hymenoscyphus albidus]|uniref:Uncharacterized protein n=1 Tax=Hymenoscyphus albidus TaxID=595503 RepID=A0A9N9Q2X1_9HELO|nr:hypothetical protein HYALB_00009631 [Hymenoscyphus albidus]